MTLGFCSFLGKHSTNWDISLPTDGLKKNVCMCLGMHVHSWEFRRSLWSQFSPLPSHALQRSNLGCQREQESLPTEYLILFIMTPLITLKKANILAWTVLPPHRSLKCIHVVHMCICRFVYMWRPKKNTGDPLVLSAYSLIEDEDAIFFLTRQMVNKDFSLVLLPPSIAGGYRPGKQREYWDPKTAGFLLTTPSPHPNNPAQTFSSD